MLTDGRKNELTDMTKLIAAFRNVANAPNRTSTRIERRLHPSLVFALKLNTLSLKFPSFVFPIYDRHFYVCEVTCVSRAVVDSQLANA